jgi:hypothetical protein
MRIRRRLKTGFEATYFAGFRNIVD